MRTFQVNLHSVIYGVSDLRSMVRWGTKDVLSSQIDFTVKVIHTYILTDVTYDTTFDTDFDTTFSGPAGWIGSIR